MPDMAGVGKAAEHLDDVQTAMYFMAVLLVALITRDLVTGWRAAATASRLASAIDKLREVIGNGDAQAMANMAVIQHELSQAREDRAEIKKALSKRQMESK